MPRTASSSKRSFWREYRIEIILALIILVGVFLLVERVNIRAAAGQWVADAQAAVLGGFSAILQIATRRATSLTLSDAIGAAMISLAVVIILWRVRWRLTHDERFASETCPKCGGDLYRIHRRRRDRILNKFVPVRRHKCKNPECGWTGLRFGHSTTHHRSRRSMA